MKRLSLMSACVLMISIASSMAAPVLAHAHSVGKGAVVEVYFTPWDNAEAALINVIGAARQSIHVQAYIFTSRTIAKALLEAVQRGVRVALLADFEQDRNNRTSQVGALAAQGVEVRLEVLYVNAHNKVMIIDAESSAPVVVTGSYNFSYSAQAQNAENLVLIRADKDLVQAYLKNWRRHYDDARPYTEFKP